MEGGETADESQANLPPPTPPLPPDVTMKERESSESTTAVPESSGNSSGELVETSSADAVPEPEQSATVATTGEVKMEEVIEEEGEEIRNEIEKITIQPDDQPATLAAEDATQTPPAPAPPPPQVNSNADVDETVRPEPDEEPVAAAPVIEPPPSPIDDNQSEPAMTDCEQVEEDVPTTTAADQSQSGQASADLFKDVRFAICEDIADLDKVSDEVEW